MKCMISNCDPFKKLCQQDSLQHPPLEGTTKWWIIIELHFRKYWSLCFVQWEEIVSANLTCPADNTFTIINGSLTKTLDGPESQV